MTHPTYIPCDAIGLKSAISPWIAADPVPYALLCAAADGSADGGWCGIIARAGLPILALQKSPRYPLILSSPSGVDASAVAVVVQLIADPSHATQKLHAPCAWAEAIAAALPSPVRFRLDLRLHRLEGPPRLGTPPAGIARPFHVSEVPLLRDWLIAFDQDTDQPDPPPTVDEVDALRPHLLAWSVDGAPVAMAGRKRPLLGGWSISRVYTPPAFRGRGYAGAVVHALSVQLLAEGARYLALFTDRANPISNRLYARIGFVPVQDQTIISW